MSKDKGFKSPQQLWESLSSKSVHLVEGIFYRLGVFIAKHPWKTIIITLCFVLLSSIGLMKFRIEKNPMNLWVPPESDFYHDTNWYIEKFGTNIRQQKIIITAANVLDREVLLAIEDITERINSLQVKYDGETFSLKNLCLKVPIVNFYTSSSDRKIRSLDSHKGDKNNISRTDSDSEFADPMSWVGDEFYCGFLDSFRLTCLEHNIVDIWENDPIKISGLTKYDIIKNVNKIKVNPISGHPVDYTKMLGGSKYDEHGNVVSASSVILTWYTQVNLTSVNLDEVGNLVGTEEWVSVPLVLWEAQFLDMMKDVSNNASGMNVFYEAGSSFADISGQTMFNDLDKLFIGIALMFFYVIFGLSRCNWLEIKLTLGGAGLFGVGLAYVSSVTWCSIFGISFGPIHSSLPFLLMGLGIDDMFVMSACWNHLSETESKKSLPVKVGLMLKHAGVSIVITSFTDIVALLIGAITILPSLKSFCLYAALGVFFIFCYSVTFYVAIFTLDVKRIQQNRNSILFCYKHKEQFCVSSKKTILQKLLEVFYKNVVFTIPGKAVVIIFTLILTGFSIQAVLQLEQRFDPMWFIPDDTYYKQYLNVHNDYYPDEGNMGMIFLGNINYTKEYANLYNLVEDLKNVSYIHEVDAWVEHFHRYLLKNYKIDLVNNGSEVTDNTFKSYLSRFIYSTIGGRFQMNFKFAETFKCGSPATDIIASTISFKLAKFQGPEDHIPAMNRLKHLVKSVNITSGDSYRSVWSKVFANWVTDEIIAVEVERNIELALICVMVCTVILITNLQMCFWIFICVLLTIVNVLGWMQRWGMTVDIVCCIGLELAIGLCVDYAAHVGHTFLTISKGSTAERSFKTVTSIGTAVLLGGGSTLLSLSLLSMSKAYTFQSFFKIFLLVIVFGLFNGLIFLPVVLSLIGPSAYKENDVKPTEIVELNGKLEANEKQDG